MTNNYMDKAIKSFEYLEGWQSKDGESVVSEVATEGLKALRALQSQPAHNPWQPIETAPRDRTRVLVSDRYCVDTAYFTKGEWWLYECSDDWYSCSINPTHWMPLPAAPDLNGEG